MKLLFVGLLIALSTTAHAEKKSVWRIKTVNPKTTVLPTAETVGAKESTTNTSTTPEQELITDDAYTTSTPQTSTIDWWDYDTTISESQREEVRTTSSPESIDKADTTALPEERETTTDEYDYDAIMNNLFATFTTASPKKDPYVEEPTRKPSNQATESPTTSTADSEDHQASTTEEEYYSWTDAPFATDVSSTDASSTTEEPWDSASSSSLEEITRKRTPSVFDDSVTGVNPSKDSRHANKQGESTTPKTIPNGETTERTTEPSSTTIKPVSGGWHSTSPRKSSNYEETTQVTKTTRASVGSSSLNIENSTNTEENSGIDQAVNKVKEFFNAAPLCTYIAALVASSLLVLL